MEKLILDLSTKIDQLSDNVKKVNHDNRLATELIKNKLDELKTVNAKRGSELNAIRDDLLEKYERWTSM